ncbi:MAG: hypothetical protein JJ926_07740 [Roseitalea sp.]|jgi:hypothetical protein|nr:hypothetical protein [Oceaniradius stylonematis]MBO6551863.1 hypothetical protein [Roseitalea sp.]MBO6951757.1 hypothetical protein [Rhizobiaceae bacterium]MBO6592397.1 hypothetical protein [Roseitalea sp.]MBO6598652.1 hypothetical protein [Roseitalea sp.]MBO6611098.1 hypothetical protein [Roseitalea sp.]
MGSTVMRARGSGPARALRFLAVAAGAVALAGCTIAAPGGGGSVRAPSSAGIIDGAWGDTGGVATASLTNGRFVSVANDTGNRVAEGTYVYTSRESVALDYFSLLRQTRIRANCVLANPTTLNCTNDSGQQFQLVRSAAVS